MLITQNTQNVYELLNLFPQPIDSKCGNNLELKYKEGEKFTDSDSDSHRHVISDVYSTHV